MTKETGMHVLVNIHVQDIANMCIVQVHILVTDNDKLHELLLKYFDKSLL